ncbi:hypothetical protein ASF30_10805 [Leifsonia sp. Leaf264]|nr:hypothetical protein ASF30_10805 [Leifsonia sp. Leaf264]
MSAYVNPFITSLATLSLKEWDASIVSMINTTVSLEEGLDSAQQTIILAIDAIGRSRQADAAREAASAAVRSLSWAASDELALREAARLASAAIVVLDVVSFEILLPAFIPFRLTDVAVPVKWAA